MPEPCTCGTNPDGERCPTHERMMRVIYDTYSLTNDEELLDDLFDLSDGMGDTEDGDWSAIRDSSTAAIEDMYARITEGR